MANDFFDARGAFSFTHVLCKTSAMVGLSSAFTKIFFIKSLASSEIFSKKPKYINSYKNSKRKNVKKIYE